MNELLQKFAQQVGFGSDENGEIYTSALEHLPITEDLDAFAELIVRECARVANDSNQSKNRAVGVSVGDVVRNHFGVDSQ